MGAGAVTGNRFSFTMPTGKMWTLSKNDDARARAFYCGGGETGGTGGTGPIMDAIYCTGGEGAYDGTPTYWMGTARGGCKTNNKGESMPYGRQITKEEYDRRGMVQCPDGSWDIPNGIIAPCYGRGGGKTTPSNYERCPAGPHQPPQMINGQVGCPAGYFLGHLPNAPLNSPASCVCMYWDQVLNEPRPVYYGSGVR